MELHPLEASKKGVEPDSTSFSFSGQMLLPLSPEKRGLLITEKGVALQFTEKLAAVRRSAFVRASAL